jgi:hypothetical protein
VVVSTAALNITCNFGFGGKIYYILRLVFQNRECGAEKKIPISIKNTKVVPVPIHDKKDRNLNIFTSVVLKLKLSQRRRFIFPVKTIFFVHSKKLSVICSKYSSVAANICLE